MFNDLESIDPTTLIDDEESAKQIQLRIDERRKLAAEQQIRDAKIFAIQQKPYCKWDLQEKMFMMPFIAEDIKRGQMEMANLIRRAESAISSLK